MEEVKGGRTGWHLAGASIPVLVRGKGIDGGHGAWAKMGAGAGMTLRCVLLRNPEQIRVYHKGTGWLAPDHSSEPRAGCVTP